MSHPSGSVHPDEIDAFLAAATARERDALVVGLRHEFAVLARVLGGLFDDLEHFATRLDDYRARLAGLGECAARLSAATDATTVTTTTRDWHPAVGL